MRQRFIHDAQLNCAPEKIFDKTIKHHNINKLEYKKSENNFLLRK